MHTPTKARSHPHERPAPRRARLRSWVGACLALALPACMVPTAPVQPPVQALGGVTFVGPRCADVRSCLLGQVVAAESSTPLARAAVFLVREAKPREGTAGKGAADPLRIVRLTDDQGVFTVADAPAGRYSMSVFKDARRISAQGLELGGAGTQVVPIRLAPPG